MHGVVKRSKSLNNDTIKLPELDCMGHVLDVKEINLVNTSRILIYLTDASGLLLRLEYDDYDKSDPFIRDLFKMKCLEIKERFLIVQNVQHCPETCQI